MNENRLCTRKEGLVCASCSRVYEEGEAFPLRECSRDDCGETFVSEERNCPSCNRPFSRKTADHGCEDCNEELEQGERFTCNECEESFETEEEAEEHFAEEHHNEMLSFYRELEAEVARLRQVKKESDSNTDASGGS